MSTKAQVGQKVTGKDLEIGDVVDINNGGYQMGFSNATVKQIKDNLITFFRPYVHTADFIYTGGALCYVGIEEFSVSVESIEQYILLKKGNLK